jgi:hypothetical protein
MGASPIINPQKNMAVPTLLPTNTQNETFGGVTYHIQGELVPALQVELSNTGVYFEHHVLLWKDPAVQVANRPSLPVGSVGQPLSSQT